MTVKVIDSVRLGEGGEALRTAARVAAMAGKPKPMFVPWGELFETPGGTFRFTNELNTNRRSNFPLLMYLERVEVEST